MALTSPVTLGKGPNNSTLHFFICKVQINFVPPSKSCVNSYKARVPGKSLPRAWHVINTIVNILDYYPRFGGTLPSSILFGFAPVCKACFPHPV